jgi:aerobic carbon-monoxide dehydrogenase large subunit
MPEGIGASVRRVEDARLLTGRGVFSDDFNRQGQAYAVFVRSPRAHALIKGIDTAAARRLPGVLAVYTAADCALQIAHAVVPNDLLDPTVPALTSRPGTPPPFQSGQPVFVADRARFVGDVIACVVAESLAEAKSAAEVVAVDYEPLPAVIEAEDAIAPGAPQLWDGAPGNLAFDVEKGDTTAADAIIAKAPHVVRARLRIPRVQVVPIETKGALVWFDSDGRLNFEGATQGVVFFKMMFARLFNLAPEKVRVLTKDVGGAFGIKQNMCPELVAIAFAAQKLGRPVKWMAERTEAFAADYQGRDFVTDATIALDRDGRFLAFQVEHLYNTGAYTITYVPMANAWRVTPGCYKFDAVGYRARAVLTNVSPTAVYRGAGRPEAIYVIERMVDIAAAELGMDRMELRRKNIIRPADLPMTNGSELPLKTDIDFPANMEAALRLARWDSFAARAAQSKARGKLRGFGLANYVETPTGAPIERADLLVDPSGFVRLAIGVGPSGQGSETVYMQMLSETLGLPFDKIRVVIGDSDIVKEGGGSHSVRATRLGGWVTVNAAKKVIEEGLKRASDVLEAAPADIEFAHAEFRVKGTDRVVSLFDLAKSGPLEGTNRIDKRIPAYPCGTAICEVEVDAETGHVAVVDYASVDDVGRAMNPMLVEGQLQGGIAMGIGQALMERATYGRDTGQLLTGSLMDYPLPRADDTAPSKVELRDIPALSNPLGIKGAAECGSTPGPAAVMNAVAHALGTSLDMPATAEKVWRVLHENVRSMS